MKVKQIMNTWLVCAKRMEGLKSHLILPLAQFHVVVENLRLLAFCVFMQSRFLM